jgi:DNA primase catalytic core, N-terminal domain
LPLPTASTTDTQPPTLDGSRFASIPTIATRDIQANTAAEPGIGRLLADAAEFFETYLWESESSRAARSKLAEHGLDEETIRAFEVGYAPIGPDELMNHLHGLGYSTEELIAAGLATRSVRGNPHAYFRSRVMFPVKDREGRILGFAALGTHLGTSWALWVTSPDNEVYRRSRAVFGLDRAADRIAASGTASVRRDCIEVLQAHQEGQETAVTVHTSRVTREQMLELAEGAPGGPDALELELPPGMTVESERDRSATEPGLDSPNGQPGGQTSPPEPLTPHLRMKMLGLVIATAVAAMNAWTGAPLLAVWVGSQVQSGRVVSIWGVLTVLAVLALAEGLLLWALTWLNRSYDRLTGRPVTAGQTSPWHRAKRGDRVEDIRSRYGISAPEKVVAGCVVAAFLVFEIWFFFFAGSSLGS